MTVAKEKAIMYSLLFASSMLNVARSSLTLCVRWLTMTQVHETPVMPETFCAIKVWSSKVRKNPSAQAAVTEYTIKCKDTCESEIGRFALKNQTILFYHFIIGMCHM